MSSIAIVGEAWGHEEEIAQQPFIGKAGQELNRMLNDAGLNRSDCHITNVFNARPKDNKIEEFFTLKKEGSKRFTNPLTTGKYLRPELEFHVDRLLSELATLRPNLIILLGNTACWAVLRDSKISKLRGAVAYAAADGLQGIKCLPTYHPAAVLRQYDLRHVTVLDFMKAKEECKFPDIRRPYREIWLDPTLDDIERFYLEHICGQPGPLSVDIETNYSTQITCLGFAPTKSLALVVPFFDLRFPEGSYWPTLEEELDAWDLVQIILSDPIPKLYQNGMFDMAIMWKHFGLTNKNAGEDTMLLHHALHPESPKALDFLGSVYTNEVAWKALKPKGKTFKRDD